MKHLNYLVHKIKNSCGFFKQFSFLFCFISFLAISNNSLILKTDSSKDKNDNQVNITIFVHGTHTKALSKIFKKYILLPQELTKVSDLNNKCFYKPLLTGLSDSKNHEFPLDSFYVFGWSGELSHKARQESAKQLYKSIKKITQDYKNKKINPKITIITHSHGGNVALNLAHAVEPDDLEFSIEKLVLLGCPIQEYTKEFSKNKIFKNIYNIYSKMDAIQILDLQGIHRVNKNKNVPFFSERILEPANNIRQTKIKFNDRALLHIEFILDNFLNILPDLLHEMDKLDSNVLTYLIKANVKQKMFNIIDLKTKISKKKNCKNNIKLENNIHTQKQDKLNENITIFLHGTHTFSKLYIKYADNINKLENIEKISSKCITHSIAKALVRNNPTDCCINSFYVFAWSGKLNVNAREEAAKKLYESIKELVQEYNKQGLSPKITIISHSHGGNVALNLAKIANDSEFNIEKLILLGCPIQEHTKLFVNNKMFKKVYNIYSQTDLFQILDPQRFHEVNKKNKKVPFFSKRTLEPAVNLKQAKIKINNRSLFHIEFLFENFMNNLSKIVHILDNTLQTNDNCLIKINTYKNTIKVINEAFKNLSSNCKHGNI